MSARKIDLALAFLQTQPGPAARLLEQQPVEDVSEFVSGIPHTLAASVLGRMLPQYTARICALLDPERTVAFLSKMEVNLVAAVLRYSSAEYRRKVRELLPERIKIGCLIMLSYSEDAVGAWMIPDVSNLPIDCSASEGLRRLSEDQGFVDLDAVCVVDRDGNLCGVVSVKSLLNAKPDSIISAVMQSDPRSVLGRTTLTAAEQHVGWKSRDIMPVINRGNKLVGVIRHVDLRRGIELQKIPDQKTRAPGLFFEVFQAYVSSLIEMLNTLGGKR